MQELTNFSSIGYFLHGVGLLPYTVAAMHINWKCNYVYLFTNISSVIWVNISE